MLILTKFGLENVLKKMNIVEITPQSFSNMTAVGYILKDPIYVYIKDYKNYLNMSNEPYFRKIEICTEIMVQKLIFGWEIWACVEKLKQNICQYVKINKWQTISEYNGYKKENKNIDNKDIRYLKSMMKRMV
jgi:hypothetical protein